MATYVTFNADDFGLTHGVTRGICQAMQEGIVTSASVMVCAPGAEQHVRAGAPQAVGVLGLHLQLTGGRPVLPAAAVPSLVKDNGRFPSRRAGLRAHLNPTEVLAEWDAQLQRLLCWGVRPAYLDSHHHVQARPDTRPALVELAQRYGLPVRAGTAGQAHALRQAGLACPDLTLFDFFGDRLSWHRLETLLKQAAAQTGPGAVLELCCHPGYSDPDLAALSYYTTQREQELRLLTLDTARTRLQDLDLILISMADVAQQRNGLLLSSTTL